MNYQKGFRTMKYLASFGLVTMLVACSDDGPFFDPDLPPQNVQVVSGDSNDTEVQNTISWTGVPAATDYVVYVSNTPGVTDEDSVVVPAATTLNSVTHSGVDVVAGVPLYYRVQALASTESSVLSDEVTGTPQESVTANNLNDVAWSGDLLVAVGDAAVVITSPNGLQDGWAPPADLAGLGVTESLSAVTWDSTNRQFLIVGAGLTVLIGDGISDWLPQDLDTLPLSTGSATDLEDVAWVVDRYIAVGKNSVIITSDDGTSWTVANDGGVIDNTTLNGVAGNTDGSILVAVGTNGTLLTSNDMGASWGPWTVTENNELNDVTWDGSQFIVVGSGDTIYVSPDAVTWEKVNPQTPDIAFIGVTQWDSLLPADPIVGVVGSAGTFLAFPPDSSGRLNIETGTTQQLSAITWVDDGVDPAYFVMVGNDGFVLTSQFQ